LINSSICEKKLSNQSSDSHNASFITTPILAPKFSRLACNLEILSLKVSGIAHASSSSFFHCETTAFTKACFFSCAVNCSTVFHISLAYCACASA